MHENHFVNFVVKFIILIYMNIYTHTLYIHILERQKYIYLLCIYT